MVKISQQMAKLCCKLKVASFFWDTVYMFKPFRTLVTNPIQERIHYFCTFVDYVTPVQLCVEHAC